MLALYYFSVLVAIVTVAVISITPVTGFLTVMFFKPIVDTGWYVSFGPGLSLTKIYGVMIPLVALSYMFFSSNASRKLSAMPMKGIWIVYAVYVAFFTMNIVLSSGIVSGVDIFFSYINGIVGFYMMQAFITNDEDLKKLIIVLMLAGLFPVLTTLYQVITGIEWHNLSHQRSESFTRSPGLYYLINTIRYYSYQTLIALLLYAAFFGKLVLWKKLAGWLYVAIIFIVLFKTYSKAGYAAIGLGLVVWLVLNKKYMALITIALLIVFALPFYASDFSDAVYEVFHREVDAVTDGEEGDNALGGRTAGWIARMEVWGQMSFYSQVFGAGEPMKGVHNDYIAMIWHGGVIGLMIYLTLLVSIGLKLFIEIRRKVDPLLVAGFVLYLSYLIDTVGLVPSTYPHFQWLVWGTIGLALRRRQDGLEYGDDDSAVKNQVQQPKQMIDRRILSYKRE